MTPQQMTEFRSIFSEMKPISNKLAGSTVANSEMMALLFSVGGLFRFIMK